MNYFNFSIIILIVSLSWMTDAQIFPFLKQFYECKYLNMIKAGNPRTGFLFIPDPKIPNNSLKDSFYSRLGLNTLSFQDALYLIKSIFDQIDAPNCQTDLCQCVRLRRFAFDVERYSIFFESRETITGLENIITSLDSKFGSNRLTYDKSGSIYLYLDPLNFPVLSKFAYNYEFTAIRAKQYLGYFNCINFDQYSPVIIG